MIFGRKGYIRVFVRKTTGNLNITSSGPLLIDVDGKASRHNGPLTITSSGGGVQVSAAAVTVAQGTTKVVVSSAQPGGIVATSEGSWRGRLSIQAAGGGLRVVNELLIDDWLKGVIPAEIGADSLPEAIKAQAIAARSEAIFRLIKPPHASEGYDFCTGVHCQAYKGTKPETPASNAACDETLGTVLFAAGDVVNGVYHNVCGGITAGAEDVWNSNALPGLTPVIDASQPPRAFDFTSEADAATQILSPGTDAFCNPANPDYAGYAKKYFRWSKTLSAAEIMKAGGVGKVRDVVVTERRKSGRVRKLTITGDSGSRTIEKELPIRNALGLWSGLFVLSIDKAGGYVTSVTFKGAGNGHGVGLCQHGAREMARRGMTYQQILKHYYPEAAIQKIYRP